MLDGRVLMMASGILLSGAWLGAGCAAADPDFGDGDGGEDSTSTTTTSGQGGGTGGEGAGTSNACGQDCSQIETPDCYRSVCNEGGHPGPVGTCVVVPDDDGVPCDDGMFCTVNDTCQAGVCTGGAQNDCGVAPGACELSTCDESTDSCGSELVPDGDPCSGDLCQVGGTCESGVCVGGTEKSCFFAPVPDDCHVSECNPSTGMCEPTVGNEGGACSDTSDLCTVGNTCSGGVCGGGTPKDCSSLTEGCILGVCDAMTGQCTTQSVGQGMACDDLNSCTIGEICNNGSCGGGSPITSCVSNDGCCPSGCNELNDSDCAKEEYSHSFTSGSLSTSSQQCVDWGSFVSKLTGSFTKVTIRGSNDPTGVSCTNSTMATQLCNALNTSTTVSGLNCDGRVWNVGDCSSLSGQPYEINSRAVSGDCSCDSAYTVRPCINNNNWGGINGPTCGAASQTMEVICYR